ncbi:MAG: cytochrome c3 family protein [Candidatus Latescibacterota bacterium]
MGRIGSAGLSIAGLAVGTALYAMWESRQVHQPFSFNHRAHAPLACVACHQGVEMRAAAGLPDERLCLQCHATAPVTHPDEVRRWAEIGRPAAGAWGRLYRVPDHVYFSHRRHVGLAALDCVLCHGDMADQTTPPSRPLAALSMQTCLQCHRQEQASTDCAGCHR